LNPCSGDPTAWAGQCVKIVVVGMYQERYQEGTIVYLVNDMNFDH